MRTIYLFLLFLIYLSPIFAQEITVPQSHNPILLDGKYSEKEWKDAFSVQVNDSLTLYIKQDSEYLYWCLRNKNQKPSLLGIDFYINHPNGLINLHASAQLGERLFNKGTYGEWDWWNNRGWAANVSRFSNFTGQRFLRDEAKEFQLHKSRLGVATFRMMFQLAQPVPPPPFPPEAVPEDPGKWLIVKIS